MSATCSSPAFCPSAAGFEPGGGDECGHFPCLHPRQAGQDILEVVPWRNAKAAAVFHDGVEDRALLSGTLVSNEEPVSCPNLGWAEGVLIEIMPRPRLCRVHNLEAGFAVVCRSVPQSNAA